jgi:uncharacterized protein
MYSRIARTIIFVFAAAAAASGLPTQLYAAGSEYTSGTINRGVVEIETGRASDISVRMAEEIASIVDDGATRRVVPVIGKGPLQNLIDLKYLRGIDLAIVPADALDYAIAQRYLPGAGKSLTYIAKLYNEEFHLLAHDDIQQVSDLSGKTVNIDVQGSGTALTATRLFALLNMRVNLATDNQQLALQKLRKGDIAALAFVAAKPAPLFASIKPGDGLHLLSIPLSQAVTALYAPTRLTAADYPNLVAADQPADTIAVGNVLMAADLRVIPERYRNLANFIDTFFTRFDNLLGPGYNPKWQEVNIAASVPGWARHPAAQEWLQRNAPVAATPNLQELKTLFSRFIDERRRASGGAPMSTTDKDALFQQFQAWQRGQAAR